MKRVKKVTEKQFEKSIIKLRDRITPAVSDVKIDFDYTPAQKTVFNSASRRIVIRKGRRLGFTRGAAAFVIESMLSGKFKTILWGDTIHQNIRNYMERYFKPILKQIPENLWSWNVTEKILRVNGAICDFRSADNPENWEGFGYELVILNEAGIILKNRYLWENAVAPMLLDHPDSVAYIGGTPKGKGLFYELWTRGNSNDPDWQSYAFSTYDNPHLTRKSIDKFIKELGGTDNVIKQEIYGEFLDATSNELFEYSKLLEAMERIPSKSGVEIWGIDVARHGDDQSVVAKRRGVDIYKIVRRDTPDLMAFAEYIKDMYDNSDYKPDAIFVEINGMGVGLYDRLRQMSMPVTAADVSLKASNEKISNTRAEMYMNLNNAIKNGGAIPNDKRLLSELSAIEYEIREDGKFKLVPKDIIKKKIGYSPDSSDACALTYFPLQQEPFSITTAAVSAVKSIFRGF